MSDRRLNAEWGASTPVESLILGRHMPTRCACDEDEEEIIFVGHRYCYCLCWVADLPNSVSSASL